MSLQDLPMKGIKFTRSDESLEEPLLRPLFDDLVECEELIGRSDTQFARRIFVRSAFAFNEGFLYWLKEHVFHWLLNNVRKTLNINIAKLLILSDDMYKPNRSGKIKSEPNRIPFLNYCAFVLRTAAECWDIDPLHLFSDNGWNEMQKALKIRHRITHPKVPKNLEVTTADLDTVREAHRWLFNCLVDIFNSIPNLQKKAGNPVVPVENQANSSGADSAGSSNSGSDEDSDSDKK